VLLQGIVDKVYSRIQYKMIVDFMFDIEIFT